MECRQGIRDWLIRDSKGDRDRGGDGGQAQTHGNTAITALKGKTDQIRSAHITPEDLRSEPK